MRWIGLLFLLPVALAAQGARGGVVMPRGGNGAGIPNGSVPQAPPTPPEDLCTVEGHIFNAVTGELLRKATIMMNRTEITAGRSGRSTFSGMTDASGKFSISSVEPGKYRVNASHTGFLNMQYNARRPGGPGTDLELGRAQKISDLVFRLTPHGVLSGRVLDEDGDPMEGVQLQLLRYTYNQGKKQLQISNGAGTNDIGEYRMSGIQPGKYFLSATYNGRNFVDMAMFNDMALIAPVTVPQPPQQDYVPTFYPGTTDIATAAPIDVGPGAHVQGLDVRLSKAHTVHVKGNVTSSVTQARPGINLQLRPRNSLIANGGGMNRGAAVRPDGAFDFPSVAPGSYTLTAFLNQGGKFFSARQAIDVGATNLDGVNLTIESGVAVTGQVRVDGDASQQPTNVMIRLNPREPGSVMGALPNARMAPDGSFRMDDVTADAYNVNVSGLPQGFYVKAIRSGNIDVLTTGLDLTNGAVAPLDVLVSPNAPQVALSVQNPTTQQPAVAVTVVLIPQEPERRNQTYFYRTGSTDQYGRSTLSPVMPGEYRAYAWEDVQNGQWYDPEFMKPIESKGEAVSVKEGAPISVQLTMIPAK